MYPIEGVLSSGQHRFESATAKRAVTTLSNYQVLLFNHSWWMQQPPCSEIGGGVLDKSKAATIGYGWHSTTKLEA